MKELPMLPYFLERDDLVKAISNLPTDAVYRIVAATFPYQCAFCKKTGLTKHMLIHKVDCIWIMVKIEDGTLAQPQFIWVKVENGT